MLRFRDTKYLITEHGQVWSEYSNRFLKLFNNKGYKVVRFTDRKLRTVHRIVAELYISNPNNYLEINHLNNDKTDNRAENLEWCTRQMNIDHKVEQNRQVRGSNHPLAKVNEDQVIEIRRSYSTKELSLQKLANKFNVSKKLILLIVQRKKWKHI